MGGNSASISSLAAGAYIVVVTDANGCSFTDTLTLTEPPAPIAIVPTLSSSITGGFNINCNGGTDGSISLVVSGGTGSYSYAWTSGGAPVGSNQNLTNLSAGTYVVVVTDANGCTETETVILSEPPLPISISPTLSSSFTGN